ncbi:hypothetical protein WH52_11905 [Tenacibaculum holothuriorum]|uniref:Uncharacterized protein n=1 Tax=Tenacibaculum holothuriorum TaxID=1635173 RepID=A0A1Y2PA64_9FLAO|nr:hypothetical protein [Tenacibaculum holothuriorum]OSY87345.1 hypothetical protein WH52_11905 [Tenacibaculum holothuriorum]
MGLQNNIKRGLFWKHVFRVAVVFLIVVALFSLVFKTGGALFSGDFETINKVHFANNQWIRFWLSKIVIALIYAMYTVNKNMK